MQVKVFGDSVYPSLSHTTKNMPNVPGAPHYAYNSGRERSEWDWRDIKQWWAAAVREPGSGFEERKKPAAPATT